MIHVLITDDDPFIRESLKLIIGLDDQITVVGTCTHGDEALAFIQSGVQVDVVLMDIRMPVCDGVEGTLKIKQANPAISILILTTFDDDEFIVQALKNGASGYLLKNISPDRIIQGIKTVEQGNLLIHPDIAKKLASFISPSPSPSPNPPTLTTLREYGLTASEQAVVEKISEGLSNKEIAQELFLSEGTVKNYITEILSKLNLRDRTQIAIFYLKKQAGANG
ncbi:response regulator transcription factor [Paenibacillus aceris]|uniref:DNA-binding NarL/FixJ family response regulator n=1 Tax=Paenibacillus aceris TaxID=869555 RepID=A0ABS4HRS0_9BACL|nr:response regulator transcription factor [Paenibacillus aceris]MBP1961298.1 DNA-binding NarL/FixJ family response regulator [Paenibacillus aceris]NHW37914.1 response regulator transcription factor [Paenibacillus aceris]